MTTLRLRIAAIAGGLIVAAIGFLVSTRFLDLGMSVPAGPGGGAVPLTLPRTLVVTLLGIAIGVGAAVAFERTARNPQRAWLLFSFVGLVASMVPTAMLIDDIGVKGILAIMHLAVGSVVIPTVAATLPDHRAA
jgi:hypothetical protein